jgi:hypothetical protein
MALTYFSDLIKKALFSLLICLPASQAVGQAHSLIGTLPTYYQYGDISHKFGYGIYAFAAHHTLDLTPTNLYPSQWVHSYVEFDLTYKLNPNWLLTGSYTLERILPFQQAGYKENRLWLQLLWNKTFNRFTLMNRIRYDFRFVKHLDGTQLNPATSFEPRARYFLGASIPLKDGSPYIFIYQELFFNTYKEPDNILALNLTYFGLGFGLGDRFAIEPGVLGSFYPRADQTGWTFQYYFEATFYAHLNFPNKMKGGILVETDVNERKKRLKRGVQR